MQLSLIILCNKQHREFFEKYSINREFEGLYKSINNTKLLEIFETAHHELNGLFRKMNTRLPSGIQEQHYWAEDSRRLIYIIEVILDLYNNLKGTEYAFEIDVYYKEIFVKCREFLSESGGSAIPPGQDKIILYYTEPIFHSNDQMLVKSPEIEFRANLKMIGEGSYANVYKYKDEFYNRYFALKRAKKELDNKELARFRKEYDTMKGLSSPYIVEVYRYLNDESYIMEYMDCTLQEYIEKNNNRLSWDKRKGIAKQIVRAFVYTQDKGLLHRDISHRNILVKTYDDGTDVIKISDFGLVKTQDSSLTSYDSDFKGIFNDPILRIEGFSNYNILHESYALTLMVFYVMTGKTNIGNIANRSLKSFVEKGTNPNKEQRYISAKEILSEISGLIENNSYC